MQTFTHDQQPTPEYDAVQLRALAATIRGDAWVLAERWEERARELAPSGVSTDELTRFGEIPAFLAALAHQLELVADGEVEATGLGLDGTGDQALRDAALAHARTRAEAGYDQRAMITEFVVLRRAIWEHVAESSGDGPTGARGAEHVLDLLLDAVVVEAADTFFGELTGELVRRAERDPLTGLFNHQAFHDRLENELSRARRWDRELTVVSIDLDAFKHVNDTLGHLAGDAVLRRVAALLEAHTREQDIVGRLGGDEFAVVLVEAGPDSARDLIRRVRIHLAPVRRQFGLPRAFGVSFGAASYPADGDTVEQLLFTADAGMYRQKGAGRGEQMQHAGHAPELERVRVLVADDDDQLRHLCRAALEGEGFVVAEAADGQEAIARVLERPPDVLLLDVGMPRADGWEVLDELGRHPHVRHLPTVMMTGHDTPETLAQAERVGALDFVAKPFKPEDLVSTVHDVLELAELAAVRAEAS